MAGGQPTPPIVDMLVARAKIMLQGLPATVSLWKTVLCAGTLVLSLEGSSALKEWQCNWRKNKRDREAFLERKVKYLALELAVNEFRLRKIGQGKKKA